MNEFETQYEKVRLTGKLGECSFYSVLCRSMRSFLFCWGAVPERMWLPALEATGDCPEVEKKYFRKMMSWAETAGYN